MSTSSSSGNNNMGPPPNQHPRHNPPHGGNRHRKSSSLNRGWFEGTMEVISGMAPRPVTPSQSSVQSSSQTLRTVSAPNSPARGLGLGLFGGGGGNNNHAHGRGSPHHPPIDRTNSGGSVGGGSFALPNFPGGSINRLPSQDSLDRSIHNESGHGKSTAQIIRDLRQSNSALSAKMASLERRHMNDLAEVEGSAATRQKDLEQTNAKQRMKLMQYEQYKSAAESKLKQQDVDLSKVKEESAFQRHTISDLKNQLYQLQQELDEKDEQHEIEEQRRHLNEGVDDVDDDDDDENLRRPHSDDGHNLPRHPSRGDGLVIAPTSSSMSTEDLQQMALDNEELVKEIQELQEQLMEYQGYDKKLKDLQWQLEVAQKNSNGNNFAAGNPPRSTTPIHPLLKQQQDRERPPLAPSTSRDREDSITADHYRQQLQDSKGEVEPQNREFIVRDSETERELLEEAHDRRIQIDVEEIQTRIREEQKERVVELEEQLEQYAERLAEVAATLAESRQQAKNQEQYRKEEAEDLRMIQDANESEIIRLEKELDKATRELELRDEELEEIKQKYVSLVQRQEKEDEEKVENESDAERMIGVDVNSGEEATTAMSGPDDSRRIADLEEQLYNSVDMVNKLELQFEDLRKERDETIAALESDKAKSLCDFKNVMGVQDKNNDQDPEFSELYRRYRRWEENTCESKEVESLKAEIESINQRVNESTEAEKMAIEKVKHLEKQLQMHHIEETMNSKDLPKELELALTQVTDLKEEIMLLEEKGKELEYFSTDKIHKELQQSQIALLALGDEKEAMHDELMELISSLEKEKEKTDIEMKVQLERKDEELDELQKIKSRVKPLEAEKLILEGEVEKLKADQKRTTNDLQGTSRSVPSNIDAIRKSLEGKIEELNEEKSSIKAKLKDRDTTIATLLRSSIVLENKIELLEAEVKEYRDNRKSIEAELNELRRDVSSRDEEYSKVIEEMRYLKGQVKVAKTDAKRWKRSLKEDGTTSSEYRYHISTLQKANEDFSETIQERDQAIQNLVNQSMGQESHVRDLKTRISSLMKEVESVRMNKGTFDENCLRAEIDRLQEESEIFAGQIIEQDEEFKRMQRVLNKREEQISSMKLEIEGFPKNGNSSKYQSRDIDNPSSIQDRDRQISELQKKVEFLESQEASSTCVIDPIEMKNLQAELDEMQEATESNRIELRDLRQQLREAKGAAGSANDLRVQLDQARWALDEYKRNNSPEKLFNDHTVSAELDEASFRNEKLQVILEEKLVLETKLNYLESELEGREIIIKELREQLSNACTESEQLDSVSRDVDNIRGELICNAATIEALHKQNETSKEEMKIIRLELQVQIENVDSLKEQTDTLKKKNNEMEEQLQVKVNEVGVLHDQLKSSQYEMDDLNGRLQSGTSLIEQLKEQINISQNVIVDIQGQLEASISTTRDVTDQSKASQKVVDVIREDVEAKTECIKTLNERLSAMQDETDVLREMLEKKSKRVEQLEDKVVVLARDIQRSQQNLQIKTDSIEEFDRRLKTNEIQLKEASSLKMKLGSELADSQARLGALERELSDAITETSSNEELSRKNQSLVQDNASLSQKNKSLAEENTSLEKINDNLIEETDTLTNDNKILCHELQALDGQNESLNQVNESLHVDMTSLSTEKQSIQGRNGSLSQEKKNLEERVASLNENVHVLDKNNNSLTQEIRDLSIILQGLRDENRVIVDEKIVFEKQIASLTENVGALNRTNLSLNQEIKTLCQDMKSLKDDKSFLDEEKKYIDKKVASLDEGNVLLDEENRGLRDKNSNLNEKNSSLKEENVLIAKENDALEQNMHSLGQEKDSLWKENKFLVAENDTLTKTIESLQEKNKYLSEKSEAMVKDIESLKADVDIFSQEASKLTELKTRLVQTEREREASEQYTVESYEKQLSALSSDKDIEIDSLRNSLTESRGESSVKMEVMITQLSSMEDENNGLREQFELEIQAKDQQIFALEHTLHAQEQIVDTMRSEMDQLQSGMEHATKSRRGEVEEMQQEVMQIEAKAMKQEREIVALKMQLEERKLEHKADVVKLKDALAKAMEQDSPLKKTISDLQNNDRMLEVRERLEQLKARNTDLQEENLNLGGRLERAAIQISAFEVEKQQVEEIEEENVKQRQQLKEYEQLLSRSTKAARAVPLQQSSKTTILEKESNIRTKDKKKKKFSLFKRRSIDESIPETEEDYKI